MQKTTLSLLHVGSYIITVAASLQLYLITAFIDPGFVPIVKQVCCYLQTPLNDLICSSL